MTVDSMPAKEMGHTTMIFYRRKILQYPLRTNTPRKILLSENFNLLNIEFNLNKPMNRRVVNHLIYSFYYATGVISRTSLFIDKRKYGGFPDYDIPQRVEVGTDYIVGRNLGKGLSFITLPYINQLSFGLFSDNYGFYKISNRDIKFRSFIGVRSNVKISYYYLNLLVEEIYFMI